MALTQTRTALSWLVGTNPLAATQWLSIETDSIDINAQLATGVAVGLSVQISGVAGSVTTQTVDLVEILTSNDNSTWDTGTSSATSVANPYASYTISYPAAGATETVTLPIAYPENIKYMKVRITTTNIGNGSSHTYSAAILKTTV
jgi:hypothetical protein